MEFALSDDQRLMQESLHRALERICPLGHVRSIVAQGDALDAELWQDLTRLGLPGLLISEKHMGLGMGLLDAALAAEAMGRHIVPAPFLGSCVLATLALQLAGSAEQQAHWLPRMAEGKAIAGVAITESLSGRRATGGSDAGLQCHGGKLNGRALFALDAAHADCLIVTDEHDRLYCVDGHAEGIHRIPLHSIDATRVMHELQFSHVNACALPRADAGTLFRLRDAAWIMLAADTLGAGWAMIDQAVAYTGQREQFGRLIGTFQSVKHLCAEMAASLEISRALIWFAAHAWDEFPEDASLAAAHAKAHLSEVGRFVARTATEVHGGIGITDQLGLHYWFKRIGMNRQLFGGPEQVRRTAAVMQGLVEA